MIREYRDSDLPQMQAIWNEVVQDGIAFPQEKPLSPAEAMAFFAEQSFTAVFESDENGDAGSEIQGLYVLHPNNVGRCGHISNSSYAVKSTARGNRIGEKLVIHSLEKSKELGFRILQFNAVVKSNHAALHLYEKLGFVQLGIIPEGFKLDNGTYEDIVPFYKTL